MEEYHPRQGTDYRYKRLAHPRCSSCGGWGENHTPYEDYDTYLISRCHCTRKARDEWSQQLRNKALES